MKNDNRMKKMMSKKALKEYYALNRSMVAIGKNLGTRTEKSPKDYDRNRHKAEIRKMSDMD